MRASAPVPPSRSTVTRVRRLLWRRRHLLAAVCLACAAAVTVTALRPPDPPTERVLTLATDLPAGSMLTADDLHLRDVSVGSQPSGVLRDVDAAVGRPLAVGLAAGTALQPAMLTGPGLAAAAPPGTVVLPVPVADAATARLAEPGQRIDLVAAGSDVTGVQAEAEVVARDVVVLASWTPDSGGGLLEPGVGSITYLYIAAEERAITLLVGSSAWSPLRAVLRGP
jgi:pilus assembly protein CpaB